MKVLPVAWHLITSFALCATPLSQAAAPNLAAIGAAPGENTETPMSAMYISRVDATRAAEAALNTCLALHQPVSVVVADALGHTRAAFSDDNAKLVGFSSAMKKAAVVRDFKMPTKQLQARVKSDTKFAEQYENDDRYHFSAGGLPIYRDGKLMAIIAVGGAEGHDEDCARAGSQALGWSGAAPTTFVVPRSAPISSEGSARLQAMTPEAVIPAARP